MKIKSPKLIFGAIYSIIIFAIFVVVFLIIYDKPHKNDAENKTVSSQNETVSSTVNSNEVTASSPSTSKSVTTNSNSKAQNSAASSSTPADNYVPVSVAPTNPAPIPTQTEELIHFTYFGSKTSVSKTEAIDVIAYIPASATGKITGISWNTAGFTNTQIENSRITAKWTPPAGTQTGNIALGIASVTSSSNTYTISISDYLQVEIVD